MPIIRYQETPKDRHDPAIEGCRMVNKYMGATTATSGISVFAPGASVFLHTHPCEEVIVILDGAAACILDGEQHTLGRYDMLLVPPGVPHRFWNGSDEPFTMLYFYPAVDITRDAVDPRDRPPDERPHV